MTGEWQGMEANGIKEIRFSEVMIGFPSHLRKSFVFNPVLLQGGRCCEGAQATTASPNRECLGVAELSSDCQCFLAHRIHLLSIPWLVSISRVYGGLPVPCCAAVPAADLKHQIFNIKYQIPSLMPNLAVFVL